MREAPLSAESKNRTVQVQCSQVLKGDPWALCLGTCWSQTDFRRNFKETDLGVTDWQCGWCSHRRPG